MDNNEMTRIGNDLATGKQPEGRDLTRFLQTLREIAEMRASGERPDQTLHATALVHEAYMGLFKTGKQFKDRKHLYGAIAEAMRNILVSNARKKKVRKTDLEKRAIEMSGKPKELEIRLDNILDLHEALNKLAEQDAELAELVKLRTFADLSVKEAAVILEISESDAFRKWRRARAKLFVFLSK